MRLGGCAGQPELTSQESELEGGRAGKRAGGCRGAAADPGSLRAATSAALRGPGRLRACAGRGGVRASGRGHRATVSGSEEARRARRAGPGSPTPGASPRSGSAQAAAVGTEAEALQGVGGRRCGGCWSLGRRDPRPPGSAQPCPPLVSDSAPRSGGGDWGRAPRDGGR